MSHRLVISVLINHVLYSMKTEEQGRCLAPAGALSEFILSYVHIALHIPSTCSHWGLTTAWMQDVQSSRRRVDTC